MHKYILLLTDMKVLSYEKLTAISVDFCMGEGPNKAARYDEFFSFSPRAK